MGRFLVIISFVLLVIVNACKETGYPKPDNLIPEKQMADILFDIHLYEPTFRQLPMIKDSVSFTNDDLHFSILKKHDVEDSLFIKSVLYYSSMPKIYERIYKDVVNRLVIMEEELNKDKAVKIHKE